MKLVIPRQTQPDETRVALTPGVVKKLCAQSIQVAIESNAGQGAHHHDAAYEAAGAAISQGDNLWSDGDVVVTIHPPAPQHILQMRPGSILIGLLAPLKNLDAVKALAAQKVTSFSMEFIPRISRAQPMDVLSSQANIAGYKAVLLAANAGSKIYPMMITAAGTLAPSRVLVIGAGVAGLQAIATAKRLGAIVEAYDVRPEVKEQVQSLGGRFVELPLETKDAATAGGYAKEQSDEQRNKQSELMAKHVIAADAVITTAAIFGKAPPLLIPEDVVAKMSSGSVIVDMAADEEVGRGNCRLTKPGEHITTDHGVKIIGHTNLPALVPVHASQAYAANMQSFLKLITADKQIKLDMEDEIQKGAVMTHDGNIMNPMLQEKTKGQG